MKALMSDLAKKVLADNLARKELRKFLETGENMNIEIVSKNEKLVVTPKFTSKIKN